MQYALDRASVEAGQLPGDTVSVSTLFDDVRGCEKFAQRLLGFAAGASRTRLAGDDEVAYVLAGSGSLRVEGGSVGLGEGCGLFVAAGSAWSVETTAGLELVAVAVHDPLPAGRSHAVVDLGAQGRGSATAARQFALGVGPELGCASATQFLGFVPPGRAPDHYHLYDELIYVLDGQGELHIGGERSALAPGVCVHLPARLVHCLENSGESELRLLGVFSPAGSPAEAYYPDGTAAAYPGER